MSDPLKTLDGREGGLVLSKDYSADMSQAYRDGGHYQTKHEQLGPPDHEPCGTCDWGGCDEEVVRWRYGDEIGAHLPVCFAHSLEAENARLREQAEALATALADARRWMMATNDYESLSPAGHSLTRDAISTADAALRAYRGQP